MNFCDNATNESFYFAATVIALMPFISVLLMHALETSAIKVLVKRDIAPWIRERLELHTRVHALALRLIEASFLGILFTLLTGFYAIVLCH